MKTMRTIGTAVVLALALLAFVGAAQGALLDPAGKKTAKSRPAAIKKGSKPADQQAKPITQPAAEPAKTPSTKVTTGSPADYKAGAEPEGFRDKKWGTAFLKQHGGTE